ncbi:hypothetical protein OM960_14815 [Defluviimonas sp. CAU 1641]|uniref:Secreted protein n=2 Tax=Defluviimonas salinarum TaxID=2992147 RepID=A0ABT3J5A8_9RHOB|nr:hypothetical protein [Defluviimonas salinarum]
MTVIAHILRRILIALVVVATAYGSASAASRPSAEDCSTVETAHAPEHHAHEAAPTATGATDGAGFLDSVHDALHCGVHVCAAVVDHELVTPKSARLAASLGIDDHPQLVATDRYGALHRPPDA